MAKGKATAKQDTHIFRRKLSDLLERPPANKSEIARQAGMNYKVIHSMLTSTRVPDMYEAYRLANALDVPFCYLADDSIPAGLEGLRIARERERYAGLSGEEAAVLLISEIWGSPRHFLDLLTTSFPHGFADRLIKEPRTPIQRHLRQYLDGLKAEMEGERGAEPSSTG
jgi:hypothetical protein